MKNAQKSYRKYLIIFLSVTFGLCWGGALLFMAFQDVLVPIFGELELSNPLVATILYSPTISGLLIYFLVGKGKGLLGIIKKLIPRKRNLIWFPVMLVMAIIFYAAMHYGSLLFGIGVPTQTLTFSEGISKALRNLYEETGLIGGAFGWYGFLLPYFQKSMKSGSKISIAIKSGALTGLIFGLFVLPGYVVDSFETATLYPFYVTQLVVFSVFITFVFNATKGNLLIYIFTFWLLATGSQINLYFFNPQVQIMQIIFFALACAVIYYLVKKEKISTELQTFPEFIG